MFIAGEWATAESGETFEAESPATGETIGTVQQGGREDAQRAIDAANGAATAWGRLSAFERAAYLHRIGDEVERRHDALVQTLTLDQGKPLAESRDEVEELVQYWRNAAEEGKRLEGRIPNSVSTGKRVLLLRRPRGVIGVITPWNWPYTMPAELIAPALASGTRSSGRRHRRPPLPELRSPSASPRPTSRRASSTSSPAPAPSSATRLRVIRERTASASSARPRPAAASRKPRRVRRRCSSSAATGRSSSSRTQTSTSRPRRPSRRASSARVRAARPASVCSSTGTYARSSSHASPDSSPSASCSEIRSRRRRRWARSTTRAWRRRWTSTSPMPGTRSRDRPRRRARRRLPDRPLLAADDPRRRRRRSLVATEETFGPVAPVVPIDSLKQAIELANASPYGLLSAIFTRDLAKGLRYADEVRTGWVNINESSNYWETHLPFGGRAGSASGIGRVGGSAPLETFTELQTVVIA